MMFQFKVPTEGCAPTTELLERLHKDVPGTWEGNADGVVFYNDHVLGDGKIRTAFPGDWVVVSSAGARVYKTRQGIPNTIE